MSLRPLTCVAALALTLLSANLAQAQPLDDYRGPAEPEARRVPRLPEPAAPAFGEAGEAVITGASAVGASFIQHDNSAATQLSLDFSPGIDWFFARNLSFGIGTDISYADDKGYDVPGDFVETRSTFVEANLRVGWNIPLGRRVSIWPRLYLGFFYDRVAESIVTPAPVTSSGAGSSSPSGPTPTTADLAGMSGELYVPLLLHPVPHFFVGLGPLVYRSLSANGAGLAGLGDKTTVAGQLVVGGWWSGHAPEPSGEPPPAPPADAVAARIGDGDNVLFTGELGASAGATTFTGTGGHSWSVGVEPGFDYFIANHLSIGVGLQFSASGTSSTDVGGLTYTSTATSFTLVPRLGVELPLSDRLSLYLRAQLGIEADATDIKENGRDESLASTETWVGIYAPLLVHVATHAFVGFGPYVNRDITQSTAQQGYADRQFPGPHVGASLLVGGWL